MHASEMKHLKALPAKFRPIGRPSRGDGCSLAGDSGDWNAQGIFEGCSFALHWMRAFSGEGLALGQCVEEQAIMVPLKTPPRHTKILHHWPCFKSSDNAIDFTSSRV